MRDFSSISLVNVKKEQITVVIETCPLNLREIARTSFLEVKIDEEENCVTIYNLEIEAIEVEGDRCQANSTIKKYI
jgi:hypothetical protein